MMSTTAGVKEKPILFSGPMVRAILDGKKTVTRRIMKPQPVPKPVDYKYGGHWWDSKKAQSMVDVEGFLRGDDPTVAGCFCPYGEPGEQLWVRETWADTTPFMHDEGGIVYRATDPLWSEMDEEFKWKPSIHMRREYSRIQLRIDDVDVERIQEVQYTDIQAEGFEADPRVSIDDSEFRKLWDQLNAERGFPWSRNPWVWVITFSVVGGE
jgi:hypothetical protein